MRVPHLVLVAVVSGAVPLAACGGGGGTGPGPSAPATAPSGSAGGPTATPTASGSAPSASGSASGQAPPVAAGPMKAIAASTMPGDLKSLGLDAKSLPALNKLEPDKLRQVMKTFTKALGTTCSGCHDPNDFRAWTPKKKIASKMWDQFVRSLSMEDGSPVYCDSCHGGRMQFLDRHDKKALGAWMDANLVSKLKRNDKKDHGCPTCHGEDMDMHFLAKWSK
jgi:hypothetical protein